MHGLSINVLPKGHRTLFQMFRLLYINHMRLLVLHLADELVLLSLVKHLEVLNLSLQLLQLLELRLALHVSFVRYASYFTSLHILAPERLQLKLLHHNHFLVYAQVRKKFLNFSFIHACRSVPPLRSLNELAF